MSDSTSPAESAALPPWPFDKSPLTPARLVHVMRTAGDVVCSPIVPLKPALEKSKLHTFDALFARMPVSHIPYTKIQVVNKTPQILPAEYGAHIESCEPGGMRILTLMLPGMKKDDDSAFILLSSGTVLLDTQVLIPSAAMQIHIPRPVTLKLKRLKEEDRRPWEPNQTTATLPACDIKVALVMPAHEFYWESVPGTKQRALNIRKITKNSYRLDHDIGSWNVSLQSEKIARAIPDAMLLTAEIAAALPHDASSTLFRPKPVRRYLSIQRGTPSEPGESD